MAHKHIKFDWAIKRLLRNKANFEILEGFLSELLMFDVKIEEILESESNQREENDKYNRLDILVKDSKGDFMLIEVQNEREDDYYHRMLYGQAKLISERLYLGDEYSKLTKIYSINIVYFPLGVGKDYVYISDGSFRGLHLNDELQLSRKQKELYNAENVRDLFTQYYIIKVNTFDDNAKNTLDQWIYFLKNNEIKDEFKAKGLEKAKKLLRIDNLSPEDKRAYKIHIKNQIIHQAELQTAYSDGVYDTKKALKTIEEKFEKERLQKEEAKQREEEAKQREEEAKQREEEAKQREEKAKQREEEAKQREEEAKQKLAKKMREYGEPIENIVKYTGLTEDEIKN